jgi:hypothetical protein
MGKLGCRFRVNIMPSRPFSASKLNTSKLKDAQSIVENTEKTAKRIVNGWVLTVFAIFIALRLASYLGVYGCLGLILLLVPAFALYQSWKPWIRYIFMGE